jgi:hypothetical protein
VAYHLFDPTTVGTPNTQTLFGGRCRGVRFGVTAPLTVTGLRYYKVAGQSYDHPSNLALWRNDGTLLGSITGIPDASTAGWKDFTLTTPVTLAVGQGYTVAAGEDVAVVCGYLPRATVQAPAYPALWDDNIRGTSNSGAMVFPSTTDNLDPPLVDVIAGDPGPAPPNPTDPATNQSLEDWLSVDGAKNDHQSDGLPWQTKVDTAATLALATGISAILGQRAAGDTRTVWTMLLLLLDYAVTHAEQITHILDWIGGLTRPPEQDPLAAILNRIDVRVESLYDAGGGGAWADGAVLSPDRHTGIASMAFSGQVGWGSGVALHRIHIDTTDDRHPFIDLGAAGWWVPGVGWWAATLPDGSLTNRTPLEFADQWLWPVPAAATGVILWVHPAVSGTLYAYSVP